MSKEHDKLLDQLDEQLTAGKESAGKFGRGKVPEGVFVGQLIKLEFQVSSNGRPQIFREIIVNEGDYNGEACRDYQGIDNEVGMSILTNFTEMHEGVQMPEKARLIPKVLEEILALKPVYKFRWTEKNGFWSIRPISIVEYADSDPTPGEDAAEESRVEQREVTTEGNDEEEADRVRLLAFATDQRLDVTDDMSLSDLRGTVGAYMYPLEGVTSAQLKEEQEWGDDDIEAATFISQNDVDFLESIDLGDSVIRPDPKYEERKKAPPARKATPPAKKGKK